MGLIIRDYTGSILTITDVSLINNVCGTKSLTLKTNGHDSDIIQMFGRKSRRFEFGGITNSSSEQTFLENILNNTGSLVFDPEIHLITFESGHFYEGDFYYVDFYTGFDSYDYYMAYTTVFFYDLEWKDLGLRPAERGFILKAIEVS